MLAAPHMKIRLARGGSLRQLGYLPQRQRRNRLAEQMVPVMPGADVKQTRRSPRERIAKLIVAEPAANYDRIFPQPVNHHVAEKVWRVAQRFLWTDPPHASPRYFFEFLIGNHSVHSTLYLKPPKDCSIDINKFIHGKYRLAQIGQRQSRRNGAFLLARRTLMVHEIGSHLQLTR